jgi:peptidoglycan/LPS O-acetylase OafA/YrhL
MSEADAETAMTPQRRRTETDPNLGHLPALDGVRGLAIILVLIVHLTSSSYALTGSRLINAIIVFCRFGWVGVCLFFVLSGFLITGILFEALGQKSYFVRFYARRFLRIFPLYYGCLFLLFLLSGPLGISWNGSEPTYLAYLQNTPPWIYRVPVSVHRYTSHFWSLAVEEQFYLFWPWLVFAIRDRGKLIVASLLLAATAPLLRTAILLSHSVDPVFFLKFTPCQIDSLLIGGAFALAIRGRSAATLLRFSPVSFLLLISLCVAMNLNFHTRQFEADGSELFNSIGYTTLAAAFAALIGWALQPKSLGEAFFQLAPLRWFGRYSYGIYVIHFIVWNTRIFGTYPRLLIDERWHSKTLGVALGGLPALVVTLSLAWLSYRFYESPFLRLKKYFGRSVPVVAPDRHTDLAAENAAR